MKRAALIAVLAAVLGMCVYAAPALADETDDALAKTKASALLWMNKFDHTWDEWSILYLCYTQKPYVWSPDLWEPDDSVTDPQAWAEFRSYYRKLWLRFDPWRKELWHKVTRPGTRAVAGWRALAEYVCWKHPETKDTVADAQGVLSALRAEYGPRPHLVPPLTTMRRLYRQWFADHAHAPVRYVDVPMEW